MPRKKGSRNKPHTTEQQKLTHTVSTQNEILILDTICDRFEKLSEDQRIRTAFFLTHKYPEYFPLTKNK